MAEHTPTPWERSANAFGTQFIYGDLENPRQSPMGVTYCDLVCGGDNPARLTEANATFIVRAVNNHDALVKALIDARATLSAIIDSSPSIQRKRDSTIKNINDVLDRVG